MIDLYSTRLCKSYYQILQIMDNMDEYLRRAGEYPEDLIKDDAIQVQQFLEDCGKVLQDYEPLFSKFDE